MSAVPPLRIRWPHVDIPAGRRDGQLTVVRTVRDGKRAVAGWIVERANELVQPQIDGSVAVGCRDSGSAGVKGHRCDSAAIRVGEGFSDLASAYLPDINMAATVAADQRLLSVVKTTDRMAAPAGSARTFDRPLAHR